MNALRHRRTFGGGLQARRFRSEAMSKPTGTRLGRRGRQPRARGAWRQRAGAGPVTGRCTNILEGEVGFRRGDERQARLGFKKPPRPRPPGLQLSFTSLQEPTEAAGQTFVARRGDRMGRNTHKCGEGDIAKNPASADITRGRLERW